MYLEHFGLKKLPFTITPNTEFFCNLAGYQSALNVLLFSLKSGEGFIKLTGVVGAGKTLLCRKILNQLSDDFVSAYIPNPDLNPNDLRKALALELRIDCPDNDDQSELLVLINQKLLDLHDEGKKVAFIIDEAQALPDASLEALRLLTNLETESDRLLQIVLFAQPELDARLGQHQFRQLKQRITFSYKLHPINRNELDPYVCHRLSIAGYTQGSIFTRQALELLFQHSAGIPRVINILCHKAMLNAYGKGVKRVDRKSMLTAISDSHDILTQKTLNKKTRWISISAVLAAVACLGVISAHFINVIRI
jgi:MSHA biogenesis protein MshM